VHVFDDDVNISEEDEDYADIEEPTLETEEQCANRIMQKITDDIRQEFAELGLKQYFDLFT